jgi:hypothetical protein
MAKKPVLLVALLAVIGSLFVYANRDAFRRRPIQISHRLYRFAGRFSKTDSPIPVMFEFDRRLKLTSVKVLALADIQTNKYPQPLWQMVSSSNSVPTKGIVYGMDVPGMRPALKGVAAEQLDPHETYRLLVEAGSLRGEHDFTLEPAGN